MKRSELSTKFRAELTALNKKAFKKQKRITIDSTKRKEIDNMKISIQRKLPIIGNFEKLSNIFYQTKLKIHKNLPQSRRWNHIWRYRSCKLLNNHLIDSVRSLSEAGGCSQLASDYNSLEDPIENIVHCLKHHPSRASINNKKFYNVFEFNNVDSEEVSSN